VNAKERFLRIMNYQKVDRIPLIRVEGLSETAARKWIMEGHLPLGVNINDVVPYDPWTLHHLDVVPLPTFVSRTIEADDEWTTGIDVHGFTVRTSRIKSVGEKIYYYLDGPVHDRDDWEKMKKRFDPSHPHRKPPDWSPELFEVYNSSSGPLGMHACWGPGRSIKNGYMMGLERFMETLAYDTSLASDMFEFWADFLIEMARDWVANIKFDFFEFDEDGMGFKNSTMVSPETFRKIWAPPMRRVTEFLRSHGVELICYKTSGNIRPIIPVLLDIGINMHWPVECAAGMDVLELRREFGRDLRLVGGIARQAVMDGIEAVEKEFYRKVPPLMGDGGYIPAIDDIIMSDMSYAAFRRFDELVREYEL
jgi:uroporphyrinogen decarboxylase